MRIVSPPATSNEYMIAGVQALDDRTPAVHRTFEDSINAVVESIADDVCFDFPRGAKVEQVVQSFVNFDRIDKRVQLFAARAHQSHLFAQAITRTDAPDAAIVLNPF